MTDYLIAPSRTPEQSQAADYYQHGLRTEAQSLEVDEKRFADNVRHVEAWLDEGPEAPDLVRLAEYAVDQGMEPFEFEGYLVEELDVAITAAERRLAGIAPLSDEVRAAHGLSQPPLVAPFLKDVPLEDLRGRRERIAELWDAAWSAAFYQADIRANPEATDDRSMAVVRPDLDPAVALGLGINITRQLSRDEISALLVGRRTDGELVEGKKYSRERLLPVDRRTNERKWSTPIGSYDFTVSPAKSISVAYTFGSDVERAKIFNAHTEAAREAVAYIASEVGQARLGDGGKDGFEPGHVAWVEFSHYSTRPISVSVENGEMKVEAKDKQPGDPDLHTHFVIPNGVFCDSGRVGSLDTAAIQGFLFEADGYYQARLGQRLRDAGFDVRLDERTGSAQMTVIPQEICDLFSKRRLAGEALAQKMTRDVGENWDELSEGQRAGRIDRATKNFRERKNSKDDGAGDLKDWKQQAEDAGWQIPKSFELIGPTPAPLTLEQRHQNAYEVALPWLADKLEHRAVVPHWDLRLAALRGLVHAGTDGLDDIRSVTTLMREQGVMQYGERTPLVWGQETDKRYTSVTTGLHESDEKEFVRLAQAAAHDKTGAIQPWLLKHMIETSGLDFTDTHGRTQRSAIERLGTGGKFGVVVATAGAGKTTSLRPLVAAWKEMGRGVWGASLASRQTDDLVDAGIKSTNLWAFPVMMTKIKDGDIKLNENSVLAIDELGLLGTRQGLELLRYREQFGFQIVALGDDKQCQSIQAGAIIGLSRRALGAEQVPEILTTKRQVSDREKEIVRLLRDGNAAEALNMKRSDGTAEMVFGGRAGVLKRVAEIYGQRLQATGAAPSISAPTNFDAHQVGEAVRKQLGRTSGIDLRATDGERIYQLQLAAGDRVRLFQSTKADVGKSKPRAIGRNGDIMDVLSLDKSGARLRNTKNGKEGDVRWSDLPNANGRVLLAYGYASTIHTSQGSTATEHIFALPSGSGAITGATGYTASTRHREVAYLVTSEAAERIAVRESRPINDTHEITLDDKWANVAKAFVNQKKMDSALALLDRVDQVRRGAVRSFHDTIRPNDPRSPSATPATVAELVNRRRLDVAMEAVGRLLGAIREVSRPTAWTLSR